MHRSETYDLVLCANCEAEVSSDDHRAYLFGQGAALCYECALAHGGRYTEERDDWTRAPDVSAFAKLVEEAR